LNKILTICIPTYNRKKSVNLLLDEIDSSNLISYVKVIVADDGSDDGTFSSLSLKKYNQDIMIVRHESNIGIAHGYLKFIEWCETDYLMLMADDDALNNDGIIKLISFLRNIGPDLVSTAWGKLNSDNEWVDISRYKKGNPVIKLKDIRGATNHSPGIVFNTSVALHHADVIKERLKNKCYATTIYPIVVLSLLVAFSNNSCRWFDNVVGGYRLSGALPSNLVDKDGNTWGSFTGRWKEQKSFEDVYEYIHSTIIGNKNEQSMLQLLERHKLQFYYRIESALQDNNADLLQYFLMTASVRTLKAPVISIKMIVKYLIKRLKFIWYMR